jgi:OPA family glycerol-3-phosphate transporter-like MFS transporter
MFMSLGLSCSALVMIFMGTVPFATSSVTVMFALLLMNGWFQGMGWPPSGRVMVHWFSTNERGTKMAIWNVAHNIGGGMVGPIAILGMAIFSDWHSILYMHGMVALAVALLIFLMVRDTPQSQGLRTIEQHRNDYPKTFEYGAGHEQELSAKAIFFEHVLNNRFLWTIALANAFVYFVRYGVLDWAPTYLSEVKDFSFEQSGWAYAFYEFAGIPGTLICGWISDKIFNGRRAPVSIGYYIAMLIGIGFFIYGPVMLIGVQALDLAPKKAAGTAAGFTGLFGYVGGAVSANIVIGYVVDSAGWDAGFSLIAGACAVAVILISLTFRAEHRASGNELRSQADSES